MRAVVGDPDAAIAASALPTDAAAAIEQLKAEMLEAANALEFERAALLRDRIAQLRAGEAPSPAPAAPPKKPRGRRRPRS